jgi:dCMP deaminase
MRPGRDEYFLSMAHLVGTRSTCLSRQVGCVLVDSRNHVMATGYNGPAAGLPHCSHCYRKVPGEGLDLCPAIHAEVNALVQCNDIYQVSTIYCTDSPCVNCVKLFLNTTAKKIVFTRVYPGLAKDWWLQTGREWCQHEKA